ncbi:uncharacterized protein LOC62_01G000657 [Vanrija pseudolonga]|uniref:Uncharacterized protein n=1 Tax=Vanrija pseudolonga TaxID=143232 RepID=A0AAF0Y2S5_9TREE|nr:hypothetical protein LOC62_01G000657 [Vanrija pseudolonga]
MPKAPPPPQASASTASSSATPLRRPHKAASITLRSSDSMLMVDFPPEIYRLLHKLITAEWRKGIQNYWDLGDSCVEYQLRGIPWQAIQWDAVAGARLLMRILSALSAAGWSLALSTRMSRQLENTDTLFFKKTPPVERSFFAIAFPRGDRIRIIDAPKAAHDEFVATFSLIQQDWWNGVQRSEAIAPQVHEFKLKGYPFENRRKDMVPIRGMMHFLIEDLDRLGYELFASIGMDRGFDGNNHDEEMRSVDTWFLTRRDAA